MSQDQSDKAPRPPGRTGEIEAMSVRPELRPSVPQAFTENELFRGLCFAHPEGQARELAKAIAADMKKPGSVWAADNVLLIAMVSAEHTRRAAVFLGLSDDAMQRELTRVRTYLVRPPA